MKSPKAPNPYQTASAQFGGDVGAAGAQSIIGNPNVYSPYGSQTYSIAGWEQVRALTADDQCPALQPDANAVSISSPMGRQTQMQWNMNQTGMSSRTSCAACSARETRQACRAGLARRRNRPTVRQ